MQFSGLATGLARGMRRQADSYLRLALLFWLFGTFVLFPHASVWGAALPQALPQPLVPSTAIQIDIEYENVLLSLRRIDFWDGYIVLVGTATQRYGSVCLERDDFALQIGDIRYSPANREQTRAGYGIDAPGTGVFIHCLAGRKPEILLLPFVAPVNQTAATLTYRDQTVELTDSLATLLQSSATPMPTATFTPNPTATSTQTYTPTPIPTATFTPVPVVTRSGASSMFSLPLSAKARSVFRGGAVSHQGIQFTLERIDFWDTLPDATRPRQDLFMVLTGTLLPMGDGGSHCIGASAVELLIGQQRYPMDNMRSANQFYQSAYPGYILPQCVTGNTPVTTFFVFDIALADDQPFLSFHAATLQLDTSMRALAAAAGIVQVEATSVPAVGTRVLIPTATPVPTLSSGTEDATAVASLATRGVVTRNGNLRAGPGTNFALVGRVVAAQTIEVIGSDSTQSWLQLVDGSWIAAFLVTDLAIPPATLTPTPGTD